ncbi:MAG: SCO family protein [Planctomycetota bacterium]
MVHLRQYFDGSRPVLLNLGYYRCPMLCGLVLNALLDRLRELSWTPGQEFEIITVSIDPRESPSLAQLKKQSYLQAYGRPAAATGWHFLTGAEESIRILAETVGFGYHYIAERNEYAHPAVLMMLTPRGRVSRYLDGLDYSTQTLRLSLAEASEGKLGSPLDRLFLQCFYYDHEAGQYAPAARKIMTAGGLVTVVVLGLALTMFWRRESRRRRALPDLAAHKSESANELALLEHRS